MHPIDDLKSLSKEELLAQWRKLPGKQPPPARIDRLVRELAYRLQELASGKLDKNTTVSLRRHVAVFEKSLRTGHVPPQVGTPSKVKLEAGTVLSREWNGRRITVQVITAKEFQYEGKRYKSLTRIAHQVTGQHLSGPMFFGLKEVKRG